MQNTDQIDEDLLHPVWENASDKIKREIETEIEEEKQEAKKSKSQENESIRKDDLNPSFNPKISHSSPPVSKMVWIVGLFVIVSVIVIVLVAIFVYFFAREPGESTPWEPTDNSNPSSNKGVNQNTNNNLQEPQESSWISCTSSSSLSSLPKPFLISYLTCPFGRAFRLTSTKCLFIFNALESVMGLHRLKKRANQTTAINFLSLIKKKLINCDVRILGHCVSNSNVNFELTKFPGPNQLQNQNSNSEQQSLEKEFDLKTQTQDENKQEDKNVDHVLQQAQEETQTITEDGIDVVSMSLMAEITDVEIQNEINQISFTVELRTEFAQQGQEHFLFLNSDFQNQKTWNIYDVEILLYTFKKKPC